MIEYPENISRQELLDSDVATRHNISNEPHSPEHENNLKSVAWFLQSLRGALSREFGKEIPIVITSGYRSEALNTLVGGSKRSAHCHALAVDFRALGLSTEQVIDFIKEYAPFHHMLDQVIDEYGRWVHVGLRQPITQKKRWQFLKARKQKGKTVYTPYEA